MSHLQNAGYFEINGAGIPPLSSGDIDMSEALYNRPKIDGYYWYFEDDERMIVKYERGDVFFCGEAMPVKAIECPGEFRKVPEPG